MKLIYCLLAIGMCITDGYGQQLTTIGPLTIGDRLPDIQLNNVYRYPTTTLHTGRLTSPITILDFWATWCGSCIAAFPKMEQLKQRFKDSLTILMVNNSQGDDDVKVRRFFARRKEKAGEDFTLPYVLQDSLLLQYFPHEGIPHYVWLDSTQKVIAITGEASVTEYAIRQQLAGYAITAPVKDDSKLFKAAVDRLADVAQTDNVQPLYSSVFTPFIADRGYTISSPVDSAGMVSRYTVMNATLFNLYRMAYRDLFTLPYSQTFIDPLVRQQFFDTANQPRRYCYESTTTPMPIRQAERNLQLDLEKLFAVKAVRRDTLLLCNVLTTVGQPAPMTRSGGVASSDVDHTSLKKYIKHSPVQTLLDMLGALDPRPWVDETGLEKVTLDLPRNVYDLNLAAANVFLAPYHLRIDQQLRNITIALLTKAD